MCTHAWDLLILLALWLHLYNVWIVPWSISSHNINGKTHRLEIPHTADKQLNVRQFKQTQQSL